MARDVYIISSDRSGNEARALDGSTMIELFQVFEDKFEGDNWWEVDLSYMQPAIPDKEDSHMDFEVVDDTIFEDFSDAAAYFYSQVDAYGLTTKWEVTRKGDTYVW